MSLLDLTKEELRFLTKEGLDEYERQLDAFGADMSNRYGCSCPIGMHDCDNCEACGTTTHDPVGAQLADDLRDFEYQKADL